MIVSVPYVHSAFVTARGHRKSVRRTFGATVLCDIPEHADAPIALKIIKRPGATPSVEDGDEVLLAGGRLWRAAGWLDDGSPVDQAGLRTALEAKRKTDRNPFFAVQSPGSPGPMPEMAVESFVGTVQESDRDSREAEVRRMVDGWCFIRGSLHAAASEPVFHVSCAKDGLPLVLVRTADCPEDRMLPGTEIFRADRFDAVMSCARLMGGRDVQVDATIQVLDGSALRFDDEGLALVRAARAAGEFRLKPGHHDLDREHEVFAEAVASGRGGSETASAIGSLVRWMDANGLSEFAAPFRRALTRWENRPFDAAAGLDDRDIEIFDPDAPALSAGAAA